MAYSSYSRGKRAAKRTEELNEAAWGAVGPAFLGACSAMLGFVAAVMAALFPPLPWPTNTVLSALIAIAAAICLRPVFAWSKSVTAVEEHNRRLRGDFRNEDARHD